MIVLLVVAVALLYLSFIAIIARYAEVLLSQTVCFKLSMMPLCLYAHHADGFWSFDEFECISPR
jgi:hypothetical protein